MFKSRVLVKISGKNIENFIKRLIRNNIYVIKVIPISYKEIKLIIDYNDLDRLYKYKTIYDIEVLKYYGFLKYKNIFKKNIFILSFLVLGIILIYTLSNIILSIDIIHSNSDIIKLVEEELSKNEIKKYSFAYSYDKLEKVKDKILEDNKDNLEWMEIIREGTKYIVRVEERIINKDIDNNKKYDIVASKNAIITSIISSSGEKVAGINSYVKKGEVVISSYITLPDNSKALVGAQGRVLGEVWYNVDITYPYVYNEIKYTGRKKKVLVFTFLNKRISLFDFHKYKTFHKDSKYIFNNSIFPFSLTYEYQYETKVINDIYTYDEAVDKAIEVSKDKLKDKYKTIDSIKDVIIISEDDLNSKVSLSLFVKTIEDITEYKETVIEEDTPNN